ncbi:MAG: trypsin-like peptidase domain-containing protein [Actinomycetales bacterium]|nr:trypsin-like peptidase domain-containing protein [Actinomycetales bacterium]
MTDSNHSSQFVYDTSGTQAGANQAAAGGVFTKLNRQLFKHSAMTGIVIGAAMGGIVGAGVGVTAASMNSGAGTVIVNDTSRVNWVTAVAQKAEPSVVTISVADDSGNSGSGSGVVMTKTGYILTNTHVVTLEGATANPIIEVKTAGDKVYSATIVGTDPTNDLAVIKVNPLGSLTPATFANSDQVNVGDNVVAIGAPLGLDATVTSGIVSALNRTIQVANSAAPENGSSGSGGLQFLQGGSNNQNAINLTVIQTDAAINPGNSGGALVNDQGQVLGINVAIASAGSSSSGSQSGSIGVGFSIPSNNAYRIAQEIIKTGKASHAMLGAYVSDAMSSSGSGGFSIGAKIAKLMPNSPAGKAGLQVGDVVTEFNGKAVNSATDLTADVRLLAPGTKVTLTVLRGGKTIQIVVTLGNAVNLNN